LKERCCKLKCNKWTKDRRRKSVLFQNVFLSSKLISMIKIDYNCRSFFINHSLTIHFSTWRSSFTLTDLHVSLITLKVAISRTFSHAPVLYTVLVYKCAQSDRVCVKLLNYTYSIYKSKEICKRTFFFVQLFPAFFSFFFFLTLLFSAAKRAYPRVCVCIVYIV